MKNKRVIKIQITISNEYLKTRKDFLVALNKELVWVKKDALELYKKDYE